MSSETNAANASMTLLTGGGIAAAINEYQVVLSITIAFLGLIVALVFHVLDRIHKNKVMKIKTEKYREKIKQEIIKELLKERKDKSILDRLDK